MTDAGPARWLMAVSWDTFEGAVKTEEEEVVVGADAIVGWAVSKNVARTCPPTVFLLFG